MARPAERLHEPPAGAEIRRLSVVPVPSERNLSAVSLFGRLIFGGYFVMSGVNHFIGLDRMAGFAASKGVPFPALAVLASGLLLLFGGAMMLLGWKAHVGAWLIVLFLVPVTLMMHNFWEVTDPAARMNDQIHFMKNLGLIGASLMLATIRRWPLSLERP